MSFIDLARERYSCRDYQNKVVEKEKILQVIEAARIAPSAVNIQPTHFIVITDDSVKNKVAEAYPRDWFRKAPVVIAVCGDHSRSWKRKDGKDHCDIDAAIAVDHMTLAAADSGLGTCWVCAFDSKKCHQVLDLSENLEVIVLLALGYPADDNRQLEKKRKSLEEVVTWVGI